MRILRAYINTIYTIPYIKTIYATYTILYINTKL